MTCAENGRAALEKAFAMDFDLFLLDVFLPDMTAMDLIPRLRSFRPDARIITLTGQSTRELERELRELGIAYYMAKPVPNRVERASWTTWAAGKNGRTPCRACPPPAVP